MKAIFLSLLLATSAATALADDTAKIGGKWKIHINVQGNESDATCDFTQKDTDLTGSCMTDKGNKPLTGKVDGKVIKFQYDSDYEGTAFTAKYSGTLDPGGAKYAGTIVIDAIGVDGDFTGTPDK